MATWTIANLERNVADGGVTVAHWRVTETETVGEGDDAVTYSASSYGTVGFTPDASADGFIAFDSLTEANVLGWVHESTKLFIASGCDPAGSKLDTTFNAFVIYFFNKNYL